MNLELDALLLFEMMRRSVRTAESSRDDSVSQFNKLSLSLSYDSSASNRKEEDVCIRNLIFEFKQAC